MKWQTKLPEKSGGRYLVTLDTGQRRQVRQAELAEHPKGNFYWNVLPERWPHFGDVIAWTEEPKPYEPQGGRGNEKER